MQPIQKILTKFLNQPHFSETYQQTVHKILHHEAVQQFVLAHEAQVSQEMIQNSLSKLNEFVLEYDAYQQGKEGKNPGFVPKLFINQNFIDVTYQPTKEYLAQQALRKSQSFINNRMMSRDVRQATLNEVLLENQSRRTLMTEIMNFIQQFKENMYLAQGLFITGSFGIGKTYILGALANELAKMSISVTMIHYPTFANEVKAAIVTNQVQEAVNELKQPTILMIDDIGAESNSAWLRDDVLNVILEYRMKEKLPTFFTSNFTMDELAIHLQETKDGIEAVKAKRLMERIKFLAHEVQLQGENLRQKERG